MSLIFAALFSPINDITTTLEAPPAYVWIAALPEHKGENLTYPEAFKEKQRKLYPELAPLKLQRPPEQIYAQILKLVEDRDWSIVRGETETLRVEAVASTSLIGFKDDVVIEIRDAQTPYPSVHMRSRSRVGKSDLAANYKRIQAFLNDLKKL